MAKEINFFEQEIESVVTEEKLPQMPVYEQPYLPLMLENIQKNHEQKQLDKQARVHAKRIIEALLFSSSSAISFNKIREVIDTIHPFKPRIVRQLVQELGEEYISQQRAFRLEEIAEGFILRTCQEYSPYIDQLYRHKRTEKLSHAAAEVLAIIAYRQPVTRPQIDAIRGVDSSGILYTLLERNLIEVTGRLEAPGRPSLYGITQEFLIHFGLRDLNELPKLGIGP